MTLEATGTPAPAATPSAPSTPAPAAAPIAAPPAANTSLLDASTSELAPAAASEGSLLDEVGKPADPSATETEEKPPAQGAPEAYADFTLPEGVSADPAMFDSFKSLAKEMNLTQEGAQKLVDLQTQNAVAQAKAMQDSFNKIKEEWTTESLKTLGPEYKRELAVAAKAMDRFGTPELRQLLADTGVGNHKEMINLLIKAGKAISEDNFVDGSPRSAAASPASVMYPSKNN